MNQIKSTEAAACDKFTIQVPEAHPCFAGHFPGAPLVPGALLLKWIEQSLFKQYRQRISRVKQIKFHAPITPGATIYVKSFYLNNTAKLTLYTANETLAAAGHFTLCDQ